MRGVIPKGDERERGFEMETNSTVKNQGSTPEKEVSEPDTWRGREVLLAVNTSSGRIGSPEACC